MVEVSAIVKDVRRALPISITFGTPGSVNFDLNNLFKWHLKQPWDWHLLHTHPNGYNEASDIDEKLMKSLVASIYPYTLYFWVITKDSYRLYEVKLENKETWLERKNSGGDIKRIITINDMALIKKKLCFSWRDYNKVIRELRDLSYMNKKTGQNSFLEDLIYRRQKWHWNL